MPFLLNGQSYEESQIKDSLTIEFFKKEIRLGESMMLHDLDSLVKKINPKITQIGIDKRNLGYGFEHQLWWADVFESQHSEYISLILEKGVIIGIEIFDNRFEEYHFKAINEAKLQALRHIKEAEFGVINLDDTLLFPFQLKIFGHWCSITGSPPEYAQKMFKLVALKDKQALKNWTLSFDPEIQAYGMEGLFFLHKEGTYMNKDELALMEKMKKINNTLIKCEGCFFYVRKKFNKDFQKRSLQWRFKRLKQSGWFISELYD